MIDEEIRKQIRKVYNEVPMYYNMGIDIDSIENWTDIPVIEKNTVVKSGSSSLAVSAIPLLMNEKLISARTSGSTGKYMEIYWKIDDYRRSMLPLWYYRNRYYGIKPNDRLCFFYTIHYVGEAEDVYFYDKNSLGFLKSNIDMKYLVEIYNKMQEYKPVWLLLQPSMAVLLCECIDRYKLKGLDSVRYIEFSGEILTDSVRKMTAEHFDCQIANQYGANEFNSIAYECPYGHMHILESNVYVEETGREREQELIVTTRTNTAMPLIRYRIGDRGKIKKGVKCKCGNQSPVLQLNSGRVNDFIMCKNGEKKTPYALVRAVEVVNYMLEGTITQFQIEQKDIGKFNIRFVVDKDDEMYDEKYIEEVFKKNVIDRELAEAEFSFEYFNVLFPDEGTGKYRYFKNMMEEL